MEKNMIYKSLLFTLTIVVVDFFYFPTTFLFFPIGNTKIYLAIIGLFIAGLGLRNKQRAVIGNSLFTLSVFASMVSLFGFLSMTLNHTSDDSYALYIVSMYVWLSAAYVVNSWIRLVYGISTVFRICNFIIVVCVLQCIIALMVDFNSTVQLFVDRITDTEWLRSVNRMYGIGATLDTAGIRFSLALIMIGYILGDKADNLPYKIIFLYVIAFVLLAVIGNMMARTTLVGVGISLLYLLYKSELYKAHIAPSQRKVWTMMALGLMIAIPIVIYFYITNDIFYKNIRFAFEGFFSLAEKGYWEVSSNSTLKSMYVFPETVKTWLIGDGYFVNPKNDPFYMGPVTQGYYMNTDVGYLRFIFYFGILGLLAFTAYLVYAAKVCVSKFPKQKKMFLLFLIVDFVVWFKVATDIFIIFALLFLADEEDEKVQREDQCISGSLNV